MPVTPTIVNTYLAPTINFPSGPQLRGITFTGVRLGSLIYSKHGGWYEFKDVIDPNAQPYFIIRFMNRYRTTHLLTDGDRYTAVLEHLIGCYFIDHTKTTLMPTKTQINQQISDYIRRASI